MKNLLSLIFTLQKVVVLCFLYSILLIACDTTQSNNTNQPTAQVEKVNTLDAIKKRGVLRVGYLVWNPTVKKDLKTGELSGIYPDMVAEIAKAMNVKISWHETTLANFAAGLQSDQFDFSVGPTFITIPRSLAVSFSQPVAYVGNSGVVRSNSKLRPSSINDLNKQSMRIAVLQGQAMEEYCRRNAPKADLVIISGADLTAPLLAVSSGRADIGLMNSVTVAQYAAEHPEVSTVLMGDKQIEVLPLAWTTRIGDNDLLGFLNSSITYFKSTGKLNEYQIKYPIRLLYDTPKLHEDK